MSSLDRLLLDWKEQLMEKLEEVVGPFYHASVRIEERVYGRKGNTVRVKGVVLDVEDTSEKLFLRMEPTVGKREVFIHCERRLHRTIPFIVKVSGAQANGYYALSNLSLSLRTELKYAVPTALEAMKYIIHLRFENVF